MPKKILFLTSTNLSCNPRLLKELRLAVSLNYCCTVVAFNLHNWTKTKEEELNNEFKQVAFHYLETTKKDFYNWLLSSCIEKVFKKLAPFFKTSIKINGYAYSKRSWLLNNFLKKTPIIVDVVIAHNPPAFYPAYCFAKNNKIKLAIDVEDYHPGEGNNKTEQQIITFLMQQIIPKSYYSSFASPLIKIHCLQLLNLKDEEKYFVVDNVFSKEEFIAPKENKSEKIKLVWFSQFIDFGRGLEKILPFLDTHASTISLTLIGSLRSNFYENELKNRTYVTCLPSMSQSQLNQSLSNYDIGLAIEDETADFNRTICLTNKIWSYYQSGLFIVATNTLAQQNFLATKKESGICISLSNNNVSEKLNNVFFKIHSINKDKQSRFIQTQSQSWELESNKLKSIWQ
jgi:hypothetical protein